MKRIFVAILCALSISSCSRYLDIMPKGEIIPQSIADYDMLLNGGDFTVHTISVENELFLSADDYDYFSENSVDVNNPTDQNFQLYSFSVNRFANPSEREAAWADPYKNIYIYNKIIDEVMQAAASTGYSEEDKKRIQAEAYYFRALDYFYLVNLFAKHYSKENASSDAVPLVLKADVNEEVGKRNSVEEVYTQIISDLEKSLQNLPQIKVGKTRASKVAANALLARVYLYKGDYRKALEFSNNALNINGKLSDYNTEEIETAYDEEQYSYRYFGSMVGYNAKLSEELIYNFDVNTDQRFLKNYDPITFEKERFYPINQNPSVGEMVITRAEANIRLGNLQAGLDDINVLRNSRIQDNVSYYITLFPAKKDLLRFCLEERRRELFQNGTRLFDIKRLNLEPEFAKTVVHKFITEEYKAEPKSNALVMPIPASVMKFHTDWKQN